MPSARTRANRRARARAAAADGPVVQAVAVAPPATPAEPLPVVMAEVLVAEPAPAPEPAPEPAPAPAPRPAPKAKKAKMKAVNGMEMNGELLAALLTAMGKQGMLGGGAQMRHIDRDADKPITHVRTQCFNADWPKQLMRMVDGGPLAKAMKKELSKCEPIQITYLDPMKAWVVPNGRVMCYGKCFTHHKSARAGGHPEVSISGNMVLYPEDFDNEPNESAMPYESKTKTFSELLDSWKSIYSGIGQAGHFVTAMSNSFVKLFYSIGAGYMNEPALTGIDLNDYLTGSDTMEPDLICSRFGKDFLAYWYQWFKIQSVKHDKKYQDDPENVPKWTPDTPCHCPIPEDYDYYMKNKGRFNSPRDMEDYYTAGGAKKKAIWDRISDFCVADYMFQSCNPDPANRPYMTIIFAPELVRAYPGFANVPYTSIGN